MEPVVETLHGVPVADPYRWLEDGEAPEVAAWTEAQARYTRALLDRIPARETIRQRLAALFSIGTVSPPSVHRGRYFTAASTSA